VIETAGLTAGELQAGYRAAKVEGNSNDYIAYYEAWFKRMCEEGKPPDAMQRESGTRTERFWAQLIEGMDGHLYWNGPLDSGGRPELRYPNGRGGGRCVAQRFAWKLKHGELSARITVWATCGERHCMNVEHLAAAWLPRGVKSQVPTSILLERVKALATRLGHPPTAEQWDAARLRDWHSAAGIAERFRGQWTAALRAAGLEAANAGQYDRRYSTEELIEELRALAREVGRTPTTGDWRRSKRKPNVTAVARRFGSWAQTLEAAGLK
jgi:hypothetical protein